MGLVQLQKLCHYERTCGTSPKMLDDDKLIVDLCNRISVQVIWILIQARKIFQLSIKI
jgi:hypothetical protein